jgi:hypothetical protein
MKTFSNHYINYHKILTQAIVGFEFEFYTKKPYYKLLEILNRELNPIKVWGFRKYHSEMTPDEMNFKIEPDLSGGIDLVELVTGPMPYVDAKIILMKILQILQENGETDEKCSIHVNISFDDESERTITELNQLKLILNIDEDYIYNLFPNRKNNFYAKSVKKIIPFKEFKYSTDAIGIITSNLELPDTKYYGVNIKNYTKGWLEYRYIGGTDYQFKTKEIIDLMDYFVLTTWNNLDKEMTEDDNELLLDYLSDNISNFKKFNDLENFIGEFPTIRLEVDKQDQFHILKTYYNVIYDKLFDLVSNVYSLSDIIINYDTETMNMELIDGYIKGIFDLKYLNFISCQIIDGVYYKCEIYESDVKDAHLESCKIVDCEIYNTKMTNCDVNSQCILENVYFYGGFLNGEMKSGVFRGGTIGPDAIIGENVKLVTNDDNYFGTTIQDTGEEKKSISGKGKNI